MPDRILAEGNPNKPVVPVTEITVVSSPLTAGDHNTVLVEGEVEVMLPDAKFLQSSDLVFVAYTLGKEGISSQYHQYCILKRLSECGL